MAALMRSVLSIFYIERNVFLLKGNGLVVESKRYVRGLRRKPVRVLLPGNDTGKVLKPPPQPEPAGMNVKRLKEVKVSSATEHLDKSDFVKRRSYLESVIKPAQTFATKDQVDGLRFETAIAGDKRLA